jgi:O-antigen/teichoic acid export membrane protein
MKIDRSTFKNNYVQNTIWLLSERVLRMLVGVLIGAFVARYLGPEQYGLLSYALGFVGLFTAISLLGLDAVVIRELVKRPGEANAILGTSIMLKLAGTVIMWLLLALAYFVIEVPADATTLIIIIAGSTVFGAFNVIDFYFQAKVQSKYVARVQIGQLLISSIVKLLLIFASAGLIWFAWSYFLEGAILAVGLLITYRQTSKFSIKVWYADLEIARPLLKDSWWLLCYMYFFFANMNIDRVMLQSILGDSAQVGQYAAATVISAAWCVLPFVISSSVYPYIIKKFDTGQGKQKIEALFVWLFGGSVLGAALLSLISAPIIQLLFGTAYQPASSVLIIQMWGGVFIFHFALRSTVLASENLQHFTALFMFLTLVTNIAGNFILIPSFGIDGAAWATLVAWAMNVLIFPAISKKTRKFSSLFLLPPVKRAFG